MYPILIISAVHLVLKQFALRSLRSEGRNVFVKNVIFLKLRQFSKLTINLKLDFSTLLLCKTSGTSSSIAWNMYRKERSFWWRILYLSQHSFQYTTHLVTPPPPHGTRSSRCQDCARVIIYRFRRALYNRILFYFNNWRRAVTIYFGISTKLQFIVPFF